RARSPIPPAPGPARSGDHPVAPDPRDRRDRFARTIGTIPADRPRPLPTWARPLARAITGRDTIRLVTGPATRRALGEAGVKAATSGPAIHLPAPPQPTPEHIGVLAHELSHVTDRPARPRFFLDDLLDEGERRARAVGARARSVAGGLERTASERLAGA